MFLYNVHTPHKTFSIQHKDGESYAGLVARITSKSGFSNAEQSALKEGKDGAGIVYEFEGERWSLEDDDDLSILLSRIPPSSSTGATLHLNPPSHHAHFAAPTSPPAYSTASSTIKSKAQSTSKRSVSGSSNKPANGSTLLSKDFASKEHASIDVPKAPSAPSVQINGGKGPMESKSQTGRKVSKAHSDIGNHEKLTTTADGTRISKARSVMSTRSRKSKWGNDDAEPLGEVHKRKWLEFHANNGVRTVIGKVGDVGNVRMLLKSGYKQVYISRSFAVKAGLVDSKFGMGTFGYTGLKSLGNVPITVGGRTGYHQALINEEQHFDVVLGRQWLEKMVVKIDPLDQTALTYMDSGEVIPCDLVVLKDAEGNVITVT